jgi:uncharacterized protein (DUF924 family)
MTYSDIIKFWFEELTPKDWFMGGEKLDQKMRERFKRIHEQADNGELFEWRKNPEGRLAEVIILDQFSRNIYRGTRQAFESDKIALVLSQEAIRTGDDQRLPVPKRTFLYMPFMHSESPIIHETAVELFKALGEEGSLDYEYKHKKIIDRFGRYPHRNKILGRSSTPEEIEFLKGPDSSF